MDTNYKHVLVAVDGSTASENAFVKALAIAKRNESRLVIVYIVDTLSFSIFGGSYKEIFTEHAKDFANELLISYEQMAKEAGLLNVKLLVEQGSPKVKIAKEIAIEHNIDLIVCGATGMNAVEHLIIGSVAEHIIRYAKCDVLVVRSNEKDELTLGE